MADPSPSSPLRAHAPALLLAALAGVLAGASLYTIRYAEGTSYLRDDPRVCRNCHVMNDHYDGWSRASHHAVATCNDCHTPVEFPAHYLVKAENGFWHSFKFTVQDWHEPIRIRPKNSVVLNENCARCHATLVSELVTHGDLDCIRCHASVGHGPTR